MAGLVANRYRIDRPLDDGCCAFQAFDLQLSRTVVVKTLPEHRVDEARLARQFYQEAKAAARLTHPNLVGVYDVCEEGARLAGGKQHLPDPFMVLEWVPGCDLQAYVVHKEPLPAEDVLDPFERKLDVLIQICRALQYGHERGLTHGALNPENIRVTAGREVKILNFGITPLREPSSRKYWSPEQLQGETKRHPQSDLFSFGVILYELLCGVHPFEAETEEATRLRIVAGEYRPAAEILPGSIGQLTEIVNRSLAGKRDDRYSDFRLLEAELKRVRSRLEEEREGCRTRLAELRAALKRNARSHQPGQSRLFDLTVLESADPGSEDYEHLLRSCHQLSGVIDRLQSQPQIETLLDSAEAEAKAGDLESAFAVLGDVLRKDPGNIRARSLETSLQRRKDARNLLQEALQAEAADDVAMACILALQAVELDPSAWHAKAEFERMQAILRERKEGVLLPLRQAGAGLGTGLTRPPLAAASSERQTRFIDRRLVRVAPALALLILLGAVWVVSNRDGSGPPPVSARVATERPRPEPAEPATVSLDVVPWAKVNSIIDLRDGKPVPHGELASPCTFRLPPGRYAMTVSHPDFGSRLVRFEVAEGVTNKVSLSLLSEPQLEREIQRSVP